MGEAMAEITQRIEEQAIGHRTAATVPTLISHVLAHQRNQSKISSSTNQIGQLSVGMVSFLVENQVDGDKKTNPLADGNHETLRRSANHEADCKEDADVMPSTDSPRQDDLSDVGNGSRSAATTNPEPEPRSPSSSIDKDFFREYSWSVSTRL